MTVMTMISLCYSIAWLMMMPRPTRQKYQAIGSIVATGMVTVMTICVARPLDGRIAWAILRMLGLALPFMHNGADIFWRQVFVSVDNVGLGR